MDGRDLMPELIAKWNEKLTLVEITKALPSFLAKVINSKGYKFYGTFHLGSEYDLRNFDNMLVSNYSYYISHFIRLLFLHSSII